MHFPMQKRVCAILAVCCLVLSACGGKQAKVGMTAEEADTAAQKSEDPAEDGKIKLEPLKEVHVEPSDVAKDTANTPPATSIGPMTYYPNGSGHMAAMMGTNSLNFYFQKGNVQPGTGKIGVYTVTGELFASVDVSQEGVVICSEIDEEGKALSGWEIGTKAEVFLGKAFDTDGSFYVLMDPGVFVWEGVQSNAVSDSTKITFSVKPYGISGGMPGSCQLGQQVSLTVFIGGDIDRAVVSEFDNNMIHFNQTRFTETGELVVSFIRAGDASFKLGFQERTGEVDSMTFVVHVGDEAL